MRSKPGRTLVRGLPMVNTECQGHAHQQSIKGSLPLPLPLPLPLSLSFSLIFLSHVSLQRHPLTKCCPIVSASQDPSSPLSVLDY